MKKFYSSLFPPLFLKSISIIFVSLSELVSKAHMHSRFFGEYKMLSAVLERAEALN